MTDLQLNSLQLKINKHVNAPLHLTIKAGEIWGILGPNGCGKTTLLHTLAGLKEKEAGEILLNNEPLANYHPKALAREIGILFQEMAVPLPFTVWEYCLGARFPHLAYFQRETQADAAITLQALTTMALLPFQKQKIHALSGGEKKRVAIAALLSQAPRIYLLDEPTNHLDVRHQTVALKHFKYLAEHQTNSVVMALHDVNLAAAFCDHLILFFPEGDIQAGKTGALLTEENLSRLYQCPIKPYTFQAQTFWHKIN